MIRGVLGMMLLACVAQANVEAWEELEANPNVMLRGQSKTETEEAMNKMMYEEKLADRAYKVSGVKEAAFEHAVLAKKAATTTTPAPKSKP